MWEVGPKAVCKVPPDRRCSRVRKAWKAPGRHYGRNAHTGVKVLQKVQDRCRGNRKGPRCTRNPYTTQHHTPDNEGWWHVCKARKKVAQTQVGALRAYVFQLYVWHTDYKLLDDGGWFIAYQDDASRFIVGYGVFKEATAKHAIEVLHKAMTKHGRPASILTDRGTQFYASESDHKKKGASEFEQELVRLEIRHILARVNHPQTNGKLERFHGEIQRKQKWFSGIDELVDWWNNIRPHMSLDWDNLETPAQAFVRKMPQKGTVVTDEQSGEMYDVR